MPYPRNGEPRGINARLEQVEPTPRASELDEATPESNVAAEARIVEATRTAPGGTAVVAVPGDLDRPDDDSRVVVDGDGEPELDEREPVEPFLEAGEPVEGAPPGSPPAPREGAPEVVPVDNGPGSEGSLDDSGGIAEPVGSVGDDSLDDADAELVGRPGTPGTYEPAVVGDDRPATLLELGERVTPEPDAPWPAGSWLPYGNGKRAHYSPDGWHTGESPGYGTPSA